MAKQRLPKRKQVLLNNRPFTRKVYLVYGNIPGPANESYIEFCELGKKTLLFSIFHCWFKVCGNNSPSALPKQLSDFFADSLCSAVDYTWTWF